MSEFLKTAMAAMAAMATMTALMLMTTAACAATAAISPLQVPPGWTKRFADGGVLVQPEGLPPGKVLHLWAKEPRAMGAEGLRAFQQLRPSAFDGLALSGAPQCQPATIQGGLVSQDCSAVVAGAPVAISLYMTPSLNNVPPALIRMAISNDDALFRQHRDGLMRFRAQLNALVDASWGARADEERVRKQAADTERQQAADRSDAVDRQLRTTPGRGVPAGQIAAVVYTAQRIYVGSGSLQQNLHLLLKDGTAFLDLDLPPDQLDLDAARRLKPARVTRWRQRGQEWALLSADGKTWQPQGELIAAAPARPGESLSMSFLLGSYSIDPGTGSTANEQRFRFSPDGRYERGSRRSFSSGGTAAAGGFHSAGTATTGGDGTRSTATSQSPIGGGGTARAVDNGAAFRGRYRMEPWAVVLERDDGQTERLLFAFSDDTRGVLFIGPTAYFKDQR